MTSNNTPCSSNMLSTNLEICIVDIWVSIIDSVIESLQQLLDLFDTRLKNVLFCNQHIASCLGKNLTSIGSGEFGRKNQELHFLMLHFQLLVFKFQCQPLCKLWMRLYIQSNQIIDYDSVWIGLEHARVWKTSIQYNWQKSLFRSFDEYRGIL